MNSVCVINEQADKETRIGTGYMPALRTGEIVLQFKQWQPRIGGETSGQVQ